MNKFFSLMVVGALLAACDSGSSDISGSSGNVTLKGSGTISTTSTFRAAVDPSEMKIKIYKFAVSANTDCSDPITIYEDDAPEFSQMLDNPTIGSGSLDDGSYPCVMMEVSDVMKFTPTSDDGSCMADTEYTLDVCREDEDSTSTLIDGTVTTCTGTSEGPTIGEDRVAVYMSTSGDDSNTAFVPSSPLPLTSAFTVSGSVTATFVVDGSGQVDGTFENCDMQPPSFGFR